MAAGLSHASPNALPASLSPAVASRRTVGLLCFSLENESTLEKL